MKFESLVCAQVRGDHLGHEPDRGLSPIDVVLLHLSISCVHRANCVGFHVNSERWNLVTDHPR